MVDRHGADRDPQVFHEPIQSKLILSERLFTSPLHTQGGQEGVDQIHAEGFLCAEDSGELVMLEDIRGSSQRGGHIRGGDPGRETSGLR